MSRISSMVGLRGDMKQVVGGRLQQLVRWDCRVNDRVVGQRWLERGGGVIHVSGHAGVLARMRGPHTHWAGSWSIMPPRPSSETCQAVFVAWFPPPASDAAAALAPTATATAATMVA